MNDVYLCLGGNIGNCDITFEKAKKLLNAQVGIISKHSGIYKTQAWGMLHAPDFYNQVVLVKSALPAKEILKELLLIEYQLGRDRNKQSNEYQNRLIDLDILLFNNEIIQTEALEIPHPRMHLRNFVLVPLQEIAPNIIHPKLNHTISELLLACSDKNNIEKHEV